MYGIRRTLLGPGLGLVLTLGVAGPSWGDSLDVSFSNNTTCRVNLGPAWGSQTGCAGFNSNSSWGGSYANAHTASVIGNGTSSVTATIDAGVLGDTAGHADRITLEQYLWYNVSVTIDVDPGDAWQLSFDQDVAGLFGVREDLAGVSSASQFARWNALEGMDVRLGSGDYDVDFDVTSFASSTTGSLAFSGAESAVLTGTGDAVLTGWVRTVLRAQTQCLNQTSPSFVPCSNGHESVVLFGADGFGGSFPVTADDYATWGRSVNPDGYTATFGLTVVPEPGTALLVVAGLAGLAAQRSHRRPRS